MGQIDSNTLSALAAVLAAVVAVLLAVLVGLLATGAVRRRGEGAADDAAFVPADVSRSLGEIERRLDLLGRATAREGATTGEVVRDIQGRVSEMNAVMVSKKARGSWGEYQLTSLLSTYAGASSRIYESQYRLSNGTIVDVALHLPGSEHVLGIDSKFPMEDYRRILDADVSGDAVLARRAEQRFHTDVKRHVDDIADKYVDASETAGEAVMFVPSEAVYMQICAEDSDLFDYALARRVLVCSPTTLVGVVSTLVGATHDYERTRNVDEIVRLMGRVREDAERLDARARQVSLRLRQMTEEVDRLETSSRQISRNIERLTSGDVGGDA